MYIIKNNGDNSRDFSNPSKGGSFWFFLKTKKVNFILVLAIIIILFSGISLFVQWEERRIPEVQEIEIVYKKVVFPEPEEIEEEKPKYPYYHIPIEFTMNDIKKRGCVADGILSGYGGDTNESVDMIKRSNCFYLHRALESWADTPYFDKASRVMEKIGREDIVYGMFIAEAIKTNADFEALKKDDDFDFSDMCQKDTKNFWGVHTCRPSISKREYRKYIKYITHEAMDLGIQSFLFGQIYYQSPDDLGKKRMKEVLDDMRDYAKEKDMKIIIGAQTGTITDEKYLRMFDYIEGGVGIGEDGRLENGPCWNFLQSCWALLWHDRYATRANNVFLHLDWSGLKFDDMSVFARMDKNKRTETLKYLYNYFIPKNMAFLMPMMATINKDNGGCYGPKKGFYSANNEYSCSDEDTINAILPKND